MFRSELEAAWAAFFNIREIQYEYEPLLNLATWRPDFSITLRNSESIVLVEVKPFASKRIWEDNRHVLDKIKESYDQEFMVVLLGSSPLLPANFIFGLRYKEETPFDLEEVWHSLNLGEEDRITEDWKLAKNEVQWKP
jgi:hypothetical protein